MRSLRSIATGTAASMTAASCSAITHRCDRERPRQTAMKPSQNSTAIAMVSSTQRTAAGRRSCFGPTGTTTVGRPRMSSSRLRRARSPAWRPPVAASAAATSSGTSSDTCRTCESPAPRKRVSLITMCFSEWPLRGRCPLSVIRCPFKPGRREQRRPGAKPP